MPTVEVVVEEGTKADWRNFVENDEDGKKYDHLSDLVRSSVAEPIARDKGTTGVPDEIEDMMFDILDEFNSLQAKMSVANEALDNIQNEQLDEETVEDIVNFHRELIEDELDDVGAPNADDSERDDA